jgi:hypothetical protein
MNKEFIPYEQALELKELGLLTYKKDNDFGLLYKGSDIPSILYQQAFRWFREKYNMLSTVYSNASGFLYEWSDTIGGTHRGWSECEGPNNGGVWDTYEEAELACLKKLIEIVKNERK